MTRLNYYKILRLYSSATPREISKSYLNLRVLYQNRREPVANDIMKLIDEAYHVLNDPVKRAAYDLESTLKVPEVSAPREMNEAEKLVNAWGQSYTAQEQEYIDKIYTINKVVRAIIFALAVIFIWLVVTLRLDIAFLMIFVVFFLRVMPGSIYRIKNPPPPIEISAVE